MTITEAYNYFIKEYPKIKNKHGMISDLGNIYLVAIGIKGDFGGDTYTIDKGTRLIKEINEVIDCGPLLSRYSDEELDEMKVLEF